MMNKAKYIIRLATLILALGLVSEAMASIVVRGLVVNPSATQKREVPFKSYLPKEIKPEHIVDMGDLELAYDPKEGAYYVYKNYELEPKESATVEIELQDVWKVAQEEIISLRDEASKLARALADTDYAQRANYLSNSIESKLNQIERTQSAVNPNPSGYISDYRDNLKLLDTIKADLAATRTLAAEVKTIAPMLTWKLIVAIAIFLGILGLVFFIIWQRQIKTLSELKEDYAGTAGPWSRPASPEEGERRQAGGEEKRPGLSDIESRLKEKP